MSAASDHIILHAPAATNAGAFVDAGSRVKVGEGPDDIQAARADVLKSALAAVDAPAPASGRNRGE